MFKCLLVYARQQAARLYTERTRVGWQFGISTSRPEERGRPLVGGGRSHFEDGAPSARRPHTHEHRTCITRPRDLPVHHVYTWRTSGGTCLRHIPAPRMHMVNRTGRFTIYMQWAYPGLVTRNGAPAALNQLNAGQALRKRRLHPPSRTLYVERFERFVL